MERAVHSTRVLDDGQSCESLTASFIRCWLISLEDPGIHPVPTPHTLAVNPTVHLPRKPDQPSVRKANPPHEVARDIVALNLPWSKPKPKNIKPQAPSHTRPAPSIRPESRPRAITPSPQNRPQTPRYHGVQRHRPPPPTPPTPARSRAPQPRSIFLPPARFSPLPGASPPSFGCRPPR